MKPICFPHTYLSADAVDSLRTLFPSVVVYQPVAGRMPEEMQPLIENGFLEVVAPAPGDEDDIDRCIRDFEEWGRRHQGGTGLESALMHGSVLGEPPGSEGSLYAIAAQLKRRMSSDVASETAGAILAARIFLQLAQTADQQRHQIVGELARYERSQAQMFDALKGGRDPVAHEFEPPGADLPDHDADDRAELRMAAWARLFLNHPYSSPVFVTPSTAIIRHLAETIEGRCQVRLQDLAVAAGESSCGHGLSPENILLLLKDFAAGRIALPETRFTGSQVLCADSHVEMGWVHVWLNISPFVFFSRLVPDVAPKADPPPVPGIWRHTIVAHVSGFTKTTSRLDTPI